MSQLHKPPNYDSSETMRIPPEPGGYILTVKNAIKNIGRNDKVYIKLYLDIAHGMFKGYFNNKFISERNKSRDDLANWRCHYIIFMDNKKQLEDVEYAFNESNYRLKFSELLDKPEMMKGLKVGGVLAKEVMTVMKSQRKYLKLVVEYLTPVSSIEQGEFIVGAFFKNNKERFLNGSANKDRWEDE